MSTLSTLLPVPFGDLLELSVQLAKKEAAGHELSAAERTISDIMRVDAMVSPNGFDGWLHDTSSERIKSTLTAACCSTAWTRGSTSTP